MEDAEGNVMPEKVYYECVFPFLASDPKLNRPAQFAKARITMIVAYDPTYSGLISMVPRAQNATTITVDAGQRHRCTVGDAERGLLLTIPSESKFDNTKRQ